MRLDWGSQIKLREAQGGPGPGAAWVQRLEASQLAAPHLLTAVPLPFCR